MEHSVTTPIDAPAERVWSVISDVERWPEWTASVSSVQRLDNGPFRVGSRARVQQPKVATMVYTVTDLQPGHSFTWTAQSSGLTIVGDHRVAQGPAGSVTASLRFRYHGLLAPLVSLVAAGRIRRYLAMEAEGLKRRSEAGVPSTA